MGTMLVAREQACRGEGRERFDAVSRRDVSRAVASVALRAGRRGTVKSQRKQRRSWAGLG